MSIRASVVHEQRFSTLALMIMLFFENIQNGKTNMTLTGLTEFRQQAVQAKTYFTKRTQIIQSFSHL